MDRLQSGSFLFIIPAGGEEMPESLWLRKEKK
jgi:hypothetical protein